MKRLTALEIRDFRVRGNYFNQRSLLTRKEQHYLKREQAVADLPGYSPPVVDYEGEEGESGSIVVSEIDIPLLCDNDLEKSRHYLSLILQSRGGDSQAARDLLALTQKHPFLGKTAKRGATESRFVVPCTSEEAHSDQDISQKGSILLRLSQEGYPVPDFVVLTSQAYLDRDVPVEKKLAEAIEQLEILTLQSLGSAPDPLVFAIRSATTRYLPGVMDTYLNLGVTERTLPCLENMYGSFVARRMFLNNLRNICNALDSEQYAAVVSAVRSGLSASEVAQLIDQLSEIIRRTDPGLVEDPFTQAVFIVKHAYEEYEENKDLLLTLCRGTERGSEPYPSLIMQKMVCTVRAEEAYAGVLCSRHTQTGSGSELQTARNIFGEEMMTGTAEVESTAFADREEIKSKFPAVYHFAPHLTELEIEFESPVTIEFAVEATSRYQWFALLQLNETGMAGRAALTAVVDMHKAGTISRKRVTEIIRPYHIKQLCSDAIDQEAYSVLNSFATGVAVLPRSAVSARVYFSGEAALRAKSQGEKACLCKKTFIPTDTVVMREMDAIISLTSAAIHVVTICQNLGIPALLSLEKNGVTLHPDGRLVNSAGREIREGDWITVSSRRQAMYEGQGKFKPARLLRYMRGEAVEIAPEEAEAFRSIAYSYRYYLQLIKGLTVGQISTLDEVTRLVNVELRTQSEEASQLVNQWFDDREQSYVEQVLKCDIGDHLVQNRVFDILTLDRKIRFFKRALEKCAGDRISGYEAGAFMIGRFLSSRYPVAFWKCFTPSEIGMLVNEWVLFEKYMQVLHKMGERKLLQARKKILKEGLDELYLHPGNVKALITLKLAGVPLREAKESMLDWSDPQVGRVLELLQQPYRVFYDFSAAWSVKELEKICQEGSVPLPQPDDA
ncbi:MAG: hypothetical protein LAN37_07070 [Acidobacteriia bacterium]|nr:hypothetical protein [Terriglobia bacterium]